MLQRTITFFANSQAQRAALAALYASVPQERFGKRWEMRLEAGADIGVYCADSTEIQHVGAQFAVIMLHDLGQGRDAWPEFWMRQPWDRFDLGLLPGRAWRQMFDSNLPAHRSRAPRYGVHVVGWPKSDGLCTSDKASSPRPKKRILLRFDVQHRVLLNELVASLAHLPLDLVYAPGAAAGAAKPSSPRGHTTLTVVGEEVMPTPLLHAVDLVITDAHSVLVDAALAKVPSVHLTDWATTAKCIADLPYNRFGLGTPLRRAALPDYLTQWLASEHPVRAEADAAALWVDRPGEGAATTLTCIEAHLDDATYVPASRRALHAYIDLRRAVADKEKILQRFYRALPKEFLQNVGQAFDEAYYRTQNPDIDAAIKQGALKSGLVHWQSFGCKEGRAARFGAHTDDEAHKGGDAPQDNYRACIADKMSHPQSLPRPTRPTHQIVIAAPPLNESSGGTLVLHQLCDMLRERGVDARLWLLVDSPKIVQAANPRYAPYANQTVDPRDAVVIYPEVVDGNPLQGRHVMRWLLNRPGLSGHNSQYATSDLIMHFQPFCAIDPDPAMELCVHKYRVRQAPAGVPRQNRGCFMMRKGRDRTLVPLTSNCLNLDGSKAPQIQKALQTHSRFYSYDIYTNYLLDAAQYGATSVAIADPRLTAQQWRQSTAFYTYGIAYGLDEIPWAESTRHLVPEHLKNLERRSSAQVDALLARLSTMGWWRPANQQMPIRGDASCLAAPTPA